MILAYLLISLLFLFLKNNHINDVTIVLPAFIRTSSIIPKPSHPFPQSLKIPIPFLHSLPLFHLQFSLLFPSLPPIHLSIIFKSLMIKRRSWFIANNY